METRAHFVMVGGFVIGAVLAVFAFVIWLGQFEFERRFDIYEIAVKGTVSGLDQGADVRFNGIKVGNVTAIRLDPNDPGQVRIRVQLGADTPVKTDSVATLEQQGLTGVSIVQIRGGTAEANRLVAQPGQTFPVIPYERSGFEELLEGAPNVLTQAEILIRRLQDIFSPRNAESFSAILQNFSTFSADAATAGKNLPKISYDLREIVVELSAAAPKLADAIENVEELTREGPQVAADIRASAQSFRTLAGQLETLVAENRGSVAQFTGDGLGEIATLSRELRGLVVTLNRVAERIETQPSSAFFGPGPAEYQPGERRP